MTDRERIRPGKAVLKMPLLWEPLSRGEVLFPPNGAGATEEVSQQVMAHGGED